MTSQLVATYAVPVHIDQQRAARGAIASHLLYPQRASQTTPTEMDGRPESMPAMPGPAFCLQRDDRCWHETDQSAWFDDVRSSVLSGLSTKGSQFPSATRLGHRWTAAAATRLPRLFRTAEQCPSLMPSRSAGYDDAIPRKKGCPRPRTHWPCDGRSGMRIVCCYPCRVQHRGAHFSGVFSRHDDWWRNWVLLGD
jgi:hypothetical protein